MADDIFGSGSLDTDVLDSLELKTRDLERAAESFSRTMTRAFSTSLVGGKQFDDVLKSLALRLSDLSLRLAFRPLERMLTNSLDSLFSGVLGNGASLFAASGAVKPFAAGGVIGTPTYFPLSSGSARRNLAAGFVGGTRERGIRGRIAASCVDAGRCDRGNHRRAASPF